MKHWTGRDHDDWYFRLRMRLWDWKRQGPLARWYHRTLRRLQYGKANSRQVFEVD